MPEQNHRAAELYKPLNVLEGSLMAQYVRPNIEWISMNKAGNISESGT